MFDSQLHLVRLGLVGCTNNSLQGGALVEQGVEVNLIPYQRIRITESYEDTTLGLIGSPFSPTSPAKRASVTESKAMLLQPSTPHLKVTSLSLFFVANLNTLLAYMKVLTLGTCLSC